MRPTPPPLPLLPPATPEARVEGVMSRVRPLDEARVKSDLKQVIDGHKATIETKLGEARAAIKQYGSDKMELGEAANRSFADSEYQLLKAACDQFLAVLRVQFTQAQQAPISQVLEVSEDLSGGNFKEQVLANLVNTRPDALLEEYCASFEKPLLILLRNAGMLLEEPAPTRDTGVLALEIESVFVAAAKETFAVASTKLRQELLRKEEELAQAEKASRAMERVPEKTNGVMNAFQRAPFDSVSYKGQETALFISFAGVLRDLTGKAFGPKNTTEIQTALDQRPFTPSSGLKAEMEGLRIDLDMYRAQDSSPFVNVRKAELELRQSELLARCAREFIQSVQARAGEIFVVSADTSRAEKESYLLSLDSILRKFDTVSMVNVDSKFRQALEDLVPLLPANMIPAVAARVEAAAERLDNTANAMSTNVQPLVEAINTLTDQAFFDLLARTVISALPSPAPGLMLPFGGRTTVGVTGDLTANDVVEAMFLNMPVLFKAFVDQLPKVLAELQDPREANNAFIRALVSNGMDEIDAEQVSQNLLNIALKGAAQSPERHVIMSLGGYQLSREPKPVNLPKAPVAPRATRAPRAPLSKGVKRVGGALIFAGLVSSPYTIGGRDLTEDVKWIGTGIADFVRANAPTTSTEENVDQAPVTNPWAGLALAVYPTKASPETTAWLPDLSAARGGIDTSHGALAVSCIGGVNAGDVIHPSQVLNSPEKIAVDENITWEIPGCKITGFESLPAGFCVDDLCKAYATDGFYAVALTPEAE